MKISKLPPDFRNFNSLSEMHQIFQDLANIYPFLCEKAEIILTLYILLTANEKGRTKYCSKLLKRDFLNYMVFFPFWKLLMTSRKKCRRRQKIIMLVYSLFLLLHLCQLLCHNFNSVMVSGHFLRLTFKAQKVHSK